MEGNARDQLLPQPWTVSEVDTEGRTASRQGPYGAFGFTGRATLYATHLATVWVLRCFVENRMTKASSVSYLHVVSLPRIFTFQY
jgi:hypothetical protein